MVANNFTFSGSSSTTPGTDGGAMSGTIYKLQYVAPTTPSLMAPLSGVYNISRTPTLTGSTYANSPYSAQTSADWKITSDALGATTIWSSLGDTSHLSGITVNGSNGAFSGALLGQTSLAASTTYYGFVRYTNMIGSSAWSGASAFTTLYQGASSTKTYEFDDATPSSAFAYDTSFVEINDAGNGYARLKDLGSGSYAFGLGYSSSYTKMQKLTITNQVASDLTDFQTKVTVAYDSDMQADFDDIRFTSSDGLTDIPFWLENKTDGDSASFYIKVPFLPSLGTASVYLYYGNSAASSGSNGNGTFLMFDDFNDGNITGWTAFAAESGAVTPDVTAASNALRVNGAGGMEGGAVYGGYTFTNGIYEADVTLDTYALAGQETHMFARMSSLGPDPTGYRFGPLWAGANDLNLAREQGHNNLGNTAYTYRAGITRKMSFTLNGSSLKGSVDGTQYLTTTDGNYSSGYLGFVIDARHESQAAMQSTIDNVRVRQYVATEPTVSFDPEFSNASPSSMSIVLIDNGSLAGYAFIHRMEETRMPGSTGSVSYQLSADGITWKYWNGSAWTTASTIAGQTNSSSTLNDHLPLFSQQVGGGDLYVRILFVSDGTQPVGLDALRFYYLASNVSPDAPSSLGPASLMDGSTTSTGTPTFSFLLTDDDLTDTVKYQIEIDDTADFGSPVIDYTSVLATQGQGSFQVGQAAGSGSYAVGDGLPLSDGSYYWRVKALDDSAAESSYVVATSTSNPSFVVDGAPRYLSFEAVTGSGLESVTATSIRILLSAPHFENVTTTYSIVSASTTATGGGVDYVLSTGQAVIAAGQTSTTIPLAIVNDAIDEPNEAIGIQLSSPVNALIGSNARVLYTVLDDDAAGVTLSKSSASVAEGGATDSYTVVLDTAPTSTVEILLLVSNGQVVLSTSTIAFTASNWNVPVTVLITAVDDSFVEDEQASVVTHVVSSSNYGYMGALSVGSVAISITDNDVAVTSGSGGGATSFIPSAIIPPTLPPVAQAPVSTNPLPVSVLEPAPDPVPELVPTPSAATLAVVDRDAKAYGIMLSTEDRLRLARFVENGVSAETKVLGSGERIAMLKDVYETVGRPVSDDDLAKNAKGEIGKARNLPREVTLQPRALAAFQAIYGPNRKPNFKVPEENLAWNTLMYRIRFSRDLKKEKEGIREFRSLFKKDPKDPFQWAVVRVLGYVK